MSPYESLSRRERQIMDVLHALGSATTAQVLAEIPDPPSYSSVRALLRVLEEKGHVSHDQDGRAYIYRPTVSQAQARRSAFRRLLTTFCDDSVEQAVAALLEVGGEDISDDDLDRLESLIREARQREDER